MAGVSAIAATVSSSESCRTSLIIGVLVPYVRFLPGLPFFEGKLFTYLSSISSQGRRCASRIQRSFGFICPSKGYKNKIRPFHFSYIGFQVQGFWVNILKNLAFLYQELHVILLLLWVNLLFSVSLNLAKPTFLWFLVGKIEFRLFYKIFMVYFSIPFHHKCP